MSNASLPANRKQLYFQAFRTALPTLIIISLWVSLFALPLVAAKIWRDTAQSQLLQKLADDPSLYSTYLSQEVTWDLISLPTFVIFGIGLYGAHCSAKAYAFGDGYTASGTFFKGIATDFWRCLATTAMFGATFFLISFAKNYIGITFGESGYAVATVLQWVFGAVVACAYTFCLCQMPVYKASIWRLFSNSFLLAFAKLPQTVLAIAAGYLPFFVAKLVNNDIVTLVIVAVYASIGFAHGTMITTLYCHSALDQLVNKRLYPQIYRKGLYDDEQLSDR